jgi:hypothetical protein
MSYSAILFSKKADNLFEKLFLSGFKKEVIEEIASVEEAGTILDAEIEQLVSAISEDEDELDWRVRRQTLQQLQTVKENRDYALLTAPVEDEVLDKFFISSIPIRSYIQALIGTHLRFSIIIKIGTLRNLTLKRAWKSMVKDVWQKCITDVHPFQKGDTNQGTKHCMTIVNNVNELYKHKNIKPAPAEAVILLVSAAVHDIGKSLAAESKHEEIGSDFIDSNHGDLLIGDDWQIPIRDIVKYHTGGLPLSGLGSRHFDDKVGKSGTLRVDTQKLAAVFRLCDIADMSRTRISDIVFFLNKKERSKLDDTTYNKLFARNHIDSLKIAADHLDVIVSPTITDPSELDIVEECVKHDNDEDLQKSGTSSILQTHKMPYEFWVNGKRV